MPTPTEVEPAVHTRASRWLALLSVAVLALYSASFLAFCWLDSAPMAWDEAWFPRLPAKVAQALHDGGLAAAWQAFLTAEYNKPPLQMLATIPAVVLFGPGNLAIRLDNLLVTLVGVLGAYRLLRPSMSPWLAASLAMLLLCAPFSLSAARTEFAETYVWVVTIWFLALLLQSEDFRQRRPALLLGLCAGLGVGTKLSFPLLVGVPALWSAVRGLVVHRDQRGRIVRHLAAAALIAAAVGFLLVRHNWGLMLGHLRNQYNWVGQLYSSGPKWEADTLVRYALEWVRWFGSGMLAVLVLGLLLAPFARAVVRHVLPLLLGGLINWLYCYFHPVSDMRLTFGSFLLLFFAAALALGHRLSGHRALVVVATMAIAGSGLWALLDHTYVGTAERSILGTSGVGRVPRCPTQGADLRDAVIDHYPDPAEPRPYIVCIGDHANLNLNNLELSLIARGKDAIVSQPGYLSPEHSPLDRVLQNARAKLWMVIDTGDDMSEQSPFGGISVPILAILRAHPEVFSELPWVGQLTARAKVRLFTTIGDIGALAPRNR